jgi:hypothetical protein
MRDISTFTHEDWMTATEEEMRRGYEAMAADVEAEAEALEWCEALIGDAWVDDEDEEIKPA